MKIKIKMEKQKLLIIVLIVLVLALSSYFAFDFFGKYKQKLVFQGYYIAIDEVMNSANNENCEPFSVYYGNDTINLVKLDCLENQNLGSEGE